MLYSVELRSQAFAIVLFLNCGAKVGSFFHTTKLFANFLRKKCEKGVFPPSVGLPHTARKGEMCSAVVGLGQAVWAEKSAFFFVV